MFNNRRMFDIAMCRESGQGFKKGRKYPVVGWNNGVHIFRENACGDPVEMVCLHEDTNLVPASGEDIPVFTYCKR